MRRLSAHPVRLRRTWLLLVLPLLLLAKPALAHELSVDELRLWVYAAKDELRGQLTFDPELTRALDADIPDAQKRDRVRRFVFEQVHIGVREQPCSPQLDVRELYERGGAAPGDIVMLTCPFDASRPAQISVGLGADFPALVVQAVGMRTATAEQAAGGTLAGDGTSLTTLQRGETALFRHSPRLETEVPVEQPGSGRAQLFGAFFERGLTHVLPWGVDHLLFVVCITLAARDELRRLALLLTLFTLSHSVSVAWIAAGVWSPSAALVEPCIAASIAVAGFAAHRRMSALHVAPIVVLFGLIHGLGFAGGLAPLQHEFVEVAIALVAFNLGVEAAQLTAVFGTLALLGGAARWALPQSVTSRGALLIAWSAVVWTLARVFSP